MGWACGTYGGGEGAEESGRGGVYDHEMTRKTKGAMEGRGGE